MKALLVLLAILGVLFVAPSTYADAPSTTTWFFRVTYMSGMRAEDQDPSVSGPIMMYTGATWTCNRQAASVGKEGGLIAGFVCRSKTSPEQFVTVLAICHGTNVDSDITSAGVGDDQGWVRLQVACQTARKSAPPPSTGKTI